MDWTPTEKRSNCSLCASYDTRVEQELTHGYNPDTGANQPRAGERAYWCAAAAAVAARMTDIMCPAPSGGAHPEEAVISPVLLLELLQAAVNVVQG